MFWKFGFATSSSIDAILDKPNVSLEDILDEDDLLQECKSQNTKLINFLQQPRILKRLLEHVVGTADVGHAQGPEWEEKVKFKYPYIASEVLACDIWAIAEGLLNNSAELLEPFWDTILSYESDSPAAPLPHHSHPIFASCFRLPAHIDEAPALASISAESTSENGPGKSVLAGYWAKVNGFLLDKKPIETLAFIKSLPFVVERFAAHIEIPAVIDLLYRIIQCEESSAAAGIVDWLADHDLALLLVDLLSPSYSADIHNNTSELLKAIIALSAPSPASLNQSQDPLAPGFDSANGMTPGVVNNRIVRDLATEEVIQRMVAFMLDAAEPAAPVAEEEQPIAAKAEEEQPKPLNPRDSPASALSTLGPEALDDAGVTKPKSTARRKPHAPRTPVTPQSRSSSLITCIGIFIELIRKNNSDYFEQHLFHTLRSHLLQRQQEISEQRLAKIAMKSSEEDQGVEIARAIEEREEEDEMEGMEEAMSEVSEKLGIVHLGPMLRILCARLPDFQKLITKPKEEVGLMDTTLGKIPPLSFERYRITELYAELLHCSNMALLNRAPGVGPQYSKKGTLQGGIEGLQVLARALQGSEEGGSETEEAADLGAESAPPAHNSSQSDGPDDQPIGRRSRHMREESKTGQSDASDTADSSRLSDVLERDESATALSTASDAVEELVDGASTLAVAEDAGDREAATPEPTSAGIVPNGSLQVPSEGELFDGDLLKKRFLDCKVIPSILQLFFDYPWNNFLHNVVYDILQQFFNGRMNVGLNKALTISIFNDGDLFRRVLLGHKANDESAQGPRRIRLGYMGHLNLIAEEAVKLMERYPEEIGKAVEPSMPQPEWSELLQSLQAAREKEAGPLAGGRPAPGSSFGGMAGGNTDITAVDDNTFASYLSSQMAGNANDDDDSDEDASWLTSRMGRSHSDDSGGFEDVFQPGASAANNDEFDDDWGPFAGTADATEESSPFAQNLTSADWAAEFHREAAASNEMDSALDTTEPTSPASDPFVDLFDPDFRAKDPTVNLARSPPAVTAARLRRTSSASSSSSDRSASQAADKDAPLGPGVDTASTEATEDGKLVRTIDDGLVQKTIEVPLDDVALAIAGESTNSPTQASTQVA